MSRDADVPRTVADPSFENDLLKDMTEVTVSIVINGKQISQKQVYSPTTVAYARDRIEDFFSGWVRDVIGAEL